jgi:hypothetical protein
MSAFTTAGLGVIPETGGVDHVVRQLAWQEAHEGGAIGLDDPAVLLYTARHPDGSVAGTARELGDLLDRLDRLEAAGRCPVHGKAVR